MPIFSRDEMDRRHQAIRSRMISAGLDAVIATSYAGFYWLSGAPVHAYGRPIALLLPRDGEPVMIESFIERGHTQLQSWITDLRVYWDYNPTPATDNPRPPWVSMVHHIREAAIDRGLEQKRIGIEENSLPLGHFNLLREALPKAKFINASDLIDHVRLVKSPEELILMRAADAISDHGQQMALDLIRPGRTADRINGQIRTAMAEACFQDYPEMPFVIHADIGLLSNFKSAGHSEWTTWGADNRVEAGQVLETVFSAWLWGYSGNVERAISVGEPQGRQRELFEIMVEMNEAAITAVRPGVKASEIDALMKAMFAKHDLITPTGTGVGRGITSYEANARELKLDLRLYNDTVFEPGMVISIEPHVRENDIVYRHCNSVIVTETGCEVSSKLPRGVLWV